MKARFTDHKAQRELKKNNVIKQLGCFHLLNLPPHEIVSGAGNISCTIKSVGQS